MCVVLAPGVWVLLQLGSALEHRRCAMGCQLWEAGEGSRCDGSELCQAFGGTLWPDKSPKRG